MRRNRVTVAAGTCTFVAVLVGFVLALVGFANARAERELAKNDAAAAKAVTDFFCEDVLNNASPVQSTNRELTLKEVLDAAALRDR